MRVDLFDFDLPPERIAQHPISPRDAAKLLCVPTDGPFDDRAVRDLPAVLRPGDLLVVNDTKVIPTRLAGTRNAITVEVTLIEETATDAWDAFAKPGKRLKPGETVQFAGGLEAVVGDKRADGRIGLRFNASGVSLREALWRVGSMPLPPYIKRTKGRGTTEDDADRSDYQTIFASKEGAVAAPTASLHFTEDLIARLETAGFGFERLTLHVGAGTFLPVKSDDTGAHVMHSERAYLQGDVADRLTRHRARGGCIVAVGTTVARTLESAATKNGSIKPFNGETRLFITPGYRFTAMDRLMTNFHLPRSTLFMLVSAFSGPARMKDAYTHAIDNGYRFFSYGDACLLNRDGNPS